MRAAPSAHVISWALLALLAAANVAGYFFDLYQQFWWFDRVLHGSTMLAITLWLAVVVFGRALQAAPPHRVLAFFLLASVGIALGALWEVAEWGFDQVMPGNVIKGKYDTILDIIMDTLGSALAGLVATRLLRAPADDRLQSRRGYRGAAIALSTPSEQLPPSSRT